MGGRSGLAARSDKAAPTMLRRRPVPGSPAPAMSGTPAYLSQYGKDLTGELGDGAVPGSGGLDARLPRTASTPRLGPAQELAPTAQVLVPVGGVGRRPDPVRARFDTPPMPESEWPEGRSEDALATPAAADSGGAAYEHGEVSGAGLPETDEAAEGATPTDAGAAAQAAVTDGAAPTDSGSAPAPSRSADTGRSGRAGGQPRDSEDDDTQPIPSLPDPQHGAPSLLHESVFVDSTVPGFDAPRALTIDVKKAKEPIDPQWARYRDLYAEAAAGSYALYTDIVSQLRSLAADAPAEADRAATQRQRDLDQGLGEIDRGLANSRMMLRLSFRDDLARLDAAALSARMRINRAAASGAARLRARAARIEADLTAKRGAGASIAGMPEAEVTKLATQQTATMAALNGLSANAESRLPRPAAVSQPALGNAQFEALVRDIHFPVHEANLEMQDAATQMASGLRAQIAPTARSICMAFCPFETMKASLTGEGVAAVGRARTQSLEQLGKSHRRLRRQLEKAKIEGERTLIKQHAGQRQRLIGATTDRARMELDQHQQQGKTGAAMLIAAAGAQSVALGSIYERIVQNADRGEAPLARTASEFARGLIANGVPRGRGQYHLISNRIATAGANLKRVGRLATMRFGYGARGALATFADDARKVDEAAASTVHQGEASLIALAKPISKTVDNFVTSVDRNFATALTGLGASLDQIRQGLLDNFVGNAPAHHDGAAPAPGTAPRCDNCGPEEAPPPPSPRGPNAGAQPEPVETFIARIATYASAPAEERNVLSYRNRVPRLVGENVETRSRALQTTLCLSDSAPYSVLDQLRGLTRLKGLAVEENFNTTGRNLRADLDWYLNAGNPVSGYTTRVESIRAARNYLDGRTVEGARHELNVCVEWSNDSGQIDIVMKSLSPEEMGQMFAGDQPGLDAVYNDLSDLDKQVFTALREGRVGEATALRGRATIDAGRENHGYEGTDKAGDAINAMYREAQAGNRLSGAPELRGIEGERSSRERIERDWNGIQDGFAHVVGPEYNSVGGGAAGPPERGAALINYAARGISYQIDVPDEVGEGSHRETVVDSVNDAQRRVITALVRYHTGSPEARAARAALELTRPGGADPARVHEATYNEGLNIGLVVVGAIGGREAAQRRHDQAVLDEARMYALLGEYTTQDGTAGAGANSRATLADRLASTLANDPDRAAYVRSLVMADPSDAAHEPEFINETMHQLEFAMNGAGTDVDALRRGLAGLTGEQYQMLKTRWAQAHEGENLDVRIGMPGSGTSFERLFVSETSGDTAQEMQRLRLGIVRTERERAVLGALTMFQQADSNHQSLLGPVVAGDEFRQLDGDYKHLLSLMGTSDLRIAKDGNLEFLDATGRPAPLGNFTANGTFIAAEGRTSEDLAFAITLGEGSTAAYIAATDRVADMIATALVVAAAIITTALTGGAAASIWIPVLVTAGAGLLSIGVKYAIKGDRYGSEEMLFDLATTIIQAATAGIGAAAGAALRGGSSAVGKLATTWRLSEEALATAANGGLAATKTLPALTLGQELFVGALTAGFAGGANAAIAPGSWRSKNYAGDIVAGVLRGALGGAIGAGVTRGVGKLTGPLGDVASRGLASGTSGAVSRIAEMSFDDIVLHRHVTLSEMMDQASSAFLQNMVQGMGEGMADAAMRSRSRSRHDEHQWTEDHNNERVTAREQAEAQRELRQAALAELARRNVPANDNPPPVSHVPEFDATAPVKPGSIADPEANPVLRSANDETPHQTIGRAPGEDPDGQTGPHPGLPNDDAGEFRSNNHSGDGPSWKEVMSLPTMTFEQHAEQGNRAVQSHRVEATADLTPEMLRNLPAIPEGSVIRATNPTSFEAALRNYHVMLGSDPHNELLLAFHPQSGEYAVIKGNTGRVGTPESSGWIGDRHVHPQGFMRNLAARILHNLPSGIPGDFGQMFNEVRFLRDLRNDDNVVTRVSHIDVVQPDGSIQVTSFSATLRPPPAPMEFSVRFYNPQSGEHESFGPHTDFTKYRDRVMTLTGHDIFKAPVAADTYASAGRNPAEGGGAHSPEAHRAAATAAEASMRARIAAEPMEALFSPHAATADRDAAVRRLGLTGEPHSLARLTALINEPNLTPAMRSAIAEATLSATRADLVRSGALVPGDDVVMLFRGVIAERHGDYEAGGIDLARLGPGRDEDAGRGLYGSQDLQSAMGYTGGGADGRVLPLIVRRSELGNVIDVRSGTPLGDRWLAYVRATAHEGRLMSGYEHLSGVLHPGVDMPIGLGRGGRGARFEDFLRNVAADPTAPAAMRAAAADPHITLMDLGGVASWGNDRGMLTDQFAMHHQRVADLFNEAHGFPMPGRGGGGSEEGTFRSLAGDAANDNGALNVKTAPEAELHAVKQASLATPDETAPSITAHTVPETETPHLVAEVTDAHGGHDAEKAFLDAVMGANAELHAPKPAATTYSEAMDGASNNQRRAWQDRALAEFAMAYPQEFNALRALMGNDPSAVRNAIMTANGAGRERQILYMMARLTLRGVTPADALKQARLVIGLASDMHRRLALVLRNTVEQEIWRAQIENLPAAVRAMAESSNLLLYLGGHHPALLQSLHAGFLAQPNLQPLHITAAHFEEFVARELVQHPVVQAQATGRRIVRFSTEADFNLAARTATPNTRYEFGRLAYTTDFRGRTEFSEGVPSRVKGHRGSSQTQADIGNTGTATDVGFHLIAHIFGAVVNELTVVPGNGYRIPGDPAPNLNGSAYKVEFENIVRNHLDNSSRIVEIRIQNVYNSGNMTNRPDTFLVTFRTDAGEWVTVPFVNKF